MEIIPSIIASLVALSFVIFIIWLSFRILWESIKYFFGYTANPIKYKRELSSQQSEILEKYFPYYLKLNAAKRKRFQKRLRYFIDSKKFIPKHMDRITEEMRIMIGACAVQLTFGLPALRLMYFDKILVYPDSYKSASGKIHKGEVNTKHRIIVLSWKDFVEGYSNPTDTYNVGLHEFAHALKVEDSIRNEEYDFFDTKIIAELHKEFERIQSFLQSGDHPVIRSYAGTNFDEFFAVSIECYFENPAEFYKHEGGIYTMLKLMLKQNPLD